MHTIQGNGKEIHTIPMHTIAIANAYHFHFQCIPFPFPMQTISFPLSLPMIMHTILYHTIQLPMHTIEWQGNAYHCMHWKWYCMVWYGMVWYALTLTMAMEMVLYHMHWHWQWQGNAYHCHCQCIPYHNIPLTMNTIPLLIPMHMVQYHIIANTYHTIPYHTIPFPINTIQGNGKKMHTIPICAIYVSIANACHTTKYHCQSIPVKVLTRT